ncbi:MAG: hypothetical protein KAJ51_07840, partial [Thermoplasmata archaeon]|nr:hypothetical protein [Thermoplasmata archaeon]
NITINIIPVNDPPVINNTRKWKRFFPDMLDVKNNKIIVDEENDFKIQVTAFDIDKDNLTFTDNTELFDIDPETGMISFYADYKLIDTHKVNITATDDGSDPNELSTTLTFTLDIRDSGIDHRPKTNLFSPENNSITKSLFPTLIWNGTDIDSEPSEITYTLYLSNIKEKVLSLANDVKIIGGINRTSYTFSDPTLNDLTWYYWTVIPNDGIFTGICNDGFYKFKIDTSVISPEVALVSPGNKSILNYTDVELKWNKIYDGTEVVTYDIYLGISDTELEILKQDYKETSYLLNDLANGHTYYWKVVPKAGVLPNRITGEESSIFLFTIRKTYKPPTVELISPDDRSIFKTNEISLSWRVSYKNPENVGYKLYISTSELFSITPEAELQETFYKFTAPEDRMYYWKVIPFAGDIPGPESEVRWFKIDPTVVQPIVIPKYPRNNITLNVTYLELQWSLEYSGAKSKVKYDVYLDNTTSYRPGMRQINNNYKQFFIPVTLDDNKTYYWYVIPSIETDEGFIVGEFQNNISSFKVDTNYRPPPEPGFELILDPNYLQLPLGNHTIINIILTNTGNIDLTLDITYIAEPNDLLFVNLKTRRISIPQGQLEIVDLEVSAPPGTEPNTGVTITVQAVADGVRGLADRKVLTVQVEDDEKPTSPTGNGSDSYWMYIVGIVVVLVIIMIIFSLFITKRRQKVKEEGEVETTDQRISVPSTSPYSSPTPVSVGYKPQHAVSTPPIARAATLGLGLSLPTAATSQAVKAKPIKPVTPVASA